MDKLTNRETEFRNDLRRTLYFQEILKRQLDWLAASEICPSWMKVDIQNQKNGVNRFFNNIVSKSPHTAKILRQEIQSDRAYDLAILFEKVNQIENLSDVNDWIDDMTEKAKTK